MALWFLSREFLACRSHAQTSTVTDSTLGTQGTVGIGTEVGFGNGIGTGVTLGMGSGMVGTMDGGLAGIPETSGASAGVSGSAGVSASMGETEKPEKTQMSAIMEDRLACPSYGTIGVIAAQAVYSEGYSHHSSTELLVAGP